MFLRVVVVGWACAALAIAHAPLAGHDDGECALYLPGPGRTSAYDYTLNLLRGNFAYEGQHTCITYDAVNQAYLEARKRIVVSQPKGDWKAEDFASAGELILDISINLARTYGLTYEEIEKGLPLIDTSRTLIREACPPVFSHVECRAGKYRRLDGLCTNLQHPTWGATMSPFQRLIGPLFADGINAPRISHTGRDLPLSRIVSRTMHPDDGFHDHAGTVMVIAWGQFMDHDYTLTATPLDPINRNDPEECCKRPLHLKHPYCNEIRVPDDDYFYRLWGVKCIDFVRGFPSPRPGCRLGSRVPYNTLTGVLDGNTVYGVTEKFSRKLRTGYGGLLRMNPVFKEYGLKDLLPLKLDIPDEGCTRPNKNMYCFEAGEIRVNEQLVLTVMHTLMAREHNRVAQGLAAVNGHWDDETLFQEARRINIAEIQHITFNEFLPILLGKDVMEKFGLVLTKEGYWDGYDPNVNPDVIASFAAAAYRFGHSLLPTAVERWSKAHKFIASKRLSDLIRRPYDLYRAGVLDEYVMGLMNQVAQAMDDSITQEVTNHLFKKVGARFGMDLVSFNMQRGREFGVPGYMEFRKFCGLGGAETFQDLFGAMPNETVRKYETIFEHPIDVDLWSGGVSERPLPGSMLGPTFACIIATQFSYSRRGDRFWYELPNQPSSFTPEQLVEVRKARLARVICDNTDIIDTVQLYPMVLPDHELNPRVPCRSGIIPSIDFSKWAEPPPFHGNAKQFITDAQVIDKFEHNGTINKNNTENDICTEPNTVIEKPLQVSISNIDNTTQKDNYNVTLSSSDSEKGEVPESAQVTADKYTDEHEDSNNVTNGDKIIKYVTKKNELPIIKPKSKGHPRNSLSRKKRSSELLTDEAYFTETRNAPLIVDYETAHVHDLREPLTSTIQTYTPNAGKVIQESALADFNIETLHDKVTEYKPNPLQSSGSSDNQENNRSLKHQESNQSSEKQQTNQSSENQRSNENSESQESNESNENNGSNESSERNYNLYKEQDRDYSSTPKTNSGEYEEYKHNSEESITSEAPKIQDVDLDDFSYERIHVNDAGKIESIKEPNDSFENDNPSSNSEEITTLKNSSGIKDTILQEPNLANYNDGETKPVVEINNESNESSEDSTEGKNHYDIKKDYNENKSFESQIKIPKDDEKQNFKTGDIKNDKVNVKQEFERIPLNYNHDKKPDNDKIDKADDSEGNNKQPDFDLSYDFIRPASGDDTLETAKKETPRKETEYDENLHYKFSDVTVKLPEIKLPEDVLEYNYDDTTKSKDDGKPKHPQKFFYYNDGDDSVEEPPQYEEGDNDEQNYYSSRLYDKNRDKDDYRNHPKKVKSEDDYDEHEDLYEKFVRERFGKPGTFQKRSEQLRTLPEDPVLRGKAQKILKKAHNLSKEAETSGDPNAGYMWTLEYKQPL